MLSAVITAPHNNPMPFRIKEAYTPKSIHLFLYSHCLPYQCYGWGLIKKLYRLPNSSANFGFRSVWKCSLTSGKSFQARVINPSKTKDGQIWTPQSKPTQLPPVYHASEWREASPPHHSSQYRGNTDYVIMYILVCYQPSSGAQTLQSTWLHPQCNDPEVAAHHMVPSCPEATVLYGTECNCKAHDGSMNLTLVVRIKPVTEYFTYWDNVTRNKLITWDRSPLPVAIHLPGNR